MEGTSKSAPLSLKKDFSKLFFVPMIIVAVCTSCGRFWGHLSVDSLRCVSAYAAQVLSDNPIGFWRLNETSGSTAYDYGSGGMNAIYGINTSLGGSPAIVGFGDYSVHNTVISPPNILNLAGYNLVPQNTNVLSVEAWMKVANAGNGVEIVNTNGGFTKGFDFYLNSGLCAANQFRLMKIGATGNLCTNGVPNDANWHHYVLVADGTGIHVYVDGNIAGTNADITSYVACDATCTLDAGADSVNTSIEEIAVYNVALSAARIQAHYAAAFSCH